MWREEFEIPEELNGLAMMWLWLRAACRWLHDSLTRYSYRMSALSNYDEPLAFGWQEEQMELQIADSRAGVAFQLVNALGGRCLSGRATKVQKFTRFSLRGYLNLCDLKWEGC